MAGRYFPQRDINTFDRFNKELVGDLVSGKDGVINQTVVVYKVSTYDTENDRYPTICKVGTGFTDENLDQLFQILSNKVILKKNPRVESSIESDIWFEPELVLEVVASEITLSPIHKTGLNLIRKDTGFALRFPKFTGKIRTEKLAEDASCPEEVSALYKNQNKTG